MPTWLSDVFGVVGTLGFMLMLVPQVLENARKKSTEGLSLVLVLSWHVAAMLSAAFFVCSDNLFMILSMASFTACCCIIEGQFVGYPQSSKETRRCQHGMVLAVSTVAIAISAGIIALCVVLFGAVPTTKYPVGDVMPSILLGLGFLPQYYIFLKTWSIEGYSFGVTVFDVTGSAANAVVLFGSGLPFAKAAAKAAPFLVIICMHAGLVTLAAVISCSARRGSDKVEHPSSQDGVLASVVPTEP